MKFYDRIWNWWFPLKPKMHSGKCDLCDNYGMIFLGGKEILCWDHYCQEMQRQIDEKDK